MSGGASTGECPRCGGEVLEMVDGLPVDRVRRWCFDCGLYYEAREEQRTLEEVNDMRAAFGLEPLKALREPRKQPRAAA